MEITVKDPRTLVNYTVSKKQYKAKELAITSIFRLGFLIVFTAIVYYILTHGKDILFMRPC